MIPEWMKDVDVGPCTCCSISIGKRKNFIKKTISGILHFVQDSLISDSYTRRNGFLQSIDARVKLISLLSLIVATSMTRDLRMLIFVYLFTLAFAYASKIELLVFLKRVWVFVPIFSGIIVLPTIFNIFTPGPVFLSLMHIGPGVFIGPFELPSEITITIPGVMSAILFTFRVATCVSVAVLLFLTTPREILFKSLRILYVPKIYVITLDMCYRYIFLFMDMVMDFYTAKKSRSIKASPIIEEQKWVGGRIGYTLVKSLAMSEKVHSAMASRGFNGEIKLMYDFTMQTRDYIVLICMMGLSMIVILISQNIIKI
jgi:cobalt/nickel transport system permease protein